jgi:hypothetical protein
MDIQVFTSCIFTEAPKNREGEGKANEKGREVVVMKRGINRAVNLGSSFPSRVTRHLAKSTF